MGEYADKIRQAIAADIEEDRENVQVFEAVRSALEKRTGKVVNKSIQGIIEAAVPGYYVYYDAEYRWGIRVRLTEKNHYPKPAKTFDFSLVDKDGDRRVDLAWYDEKNLRYGQAARDRNAGREKLLASDFPERAEADYLAARDAVKRLFGTLEGPGNPSYYNVLRALGAKEDGRHLLRLFE